MLSRILRWPVRAAKSAVRTYTGQPEVHQKPVHLPVRTNPLGASLRPTRRKASISIAEKARAQQAAPLQRASGSPVVHALALRCDALEDGALHRWESAEDAHSHPVGRALLAIPCVHSAVAIASVVAVAKRPDASWDDLVPHIEPLLTPLLAPHAPAPGDLP